MPLRARGPTAGRREKRKTRRGQTRRTRSIEQLEPRRLLAVALVGKGQSIRLSGMHTAGGGSLAGLRSSPMMRSAAIRPATTALPDLVGYDFRPGTPTAYFHVEEASVSWGDVIHLDFAFANLGASPSGSPKFNIAFYLTTHSTINPASDYQLGRLTGFTVPTANNGNAFTATVTLPASDPLSPLSTGPVTFGMFVDSDNSVAESNEANNDNRAVGADLTTVTISPPAAVVTDSVGSSTDHAVNFGSIVDDGPGNAQTVQTVTLSDNAVRSHLKVAQNGIHLTGGTNFHIVSILSNNLSNPVNVAGGFSLIAPNSSETWTVQVAFDPVAVGAVNDTLVIQTDDPASPTINVALSGTGVAQSNLLVTSPVNQSFNFGNVAVDGVGGVFSVTTVTIANNGTGPLTVNQNGIAVGGGPFSITGIISNTQGVISLGGGSKTIAANKTETWTIAVRFDPTATGLFQIPLTISSTAPQDATMTVSLLGTGVTPQHLVAPVGTVNFGSVAADGAGKQVATQTIALTNSGQLPLSVNQNGLTLATGTQFKIVSIASSTQGAISLSAGQATLAPNNAEIWTVALQFDPAAAGSLGDTLRIASNDPTSPTTSVPLAGTGLNQPIAVAAPTSLSFPATLHDGAGNAVTTQTVQLTNIGTQPLVVSQNGITLAGGTNYQVTGVVSSTHGAVNLAAGSATLAPQSAETWTISARFDPQATGLLADTLRIASNDPVNPTLSVGLSGEGVVPTVTAVYPTQAVHVAAGSSYHITWTGDDPLGSATYSLSYDSDRNPAAGLTAIAGGLPQSQTSYDWLVPASLIGSTVTVYVTIQDGPVSSGSYAAGSLTIDPSGSLALLSEATTQAAAYTLSYSYHGVNYTAAYTLSPGDNALFPTGGGETHEFHVVRHDPQPGITYDQLGNVTSTTTSDGETTTFVYNQLSRLVHLGNPDGTGVDYTYDPAGNLLTEHDPGGWELLSYDPLERLIGITYSPTNDPNDPAALALHYQYDSANRVTVVQDPNGHTATYSYDAAGRVQSLTDASPGQADATTINTYDGSTGLVTTTQWGDGTTTFYGYDSDGRLVDYLHKNASNALIVEYHYTLDSAGRCTLVTTTTPTKATAEGYQYDDLGRVASVTSSQNNPTIEPTDKVLQYQYDTAGNILQEVIYQNGLAAGPTETVTFPQAGSSNSLSAGGGASPLSATPAQGVQQGNVIEDQVKIEMVAANKGPVADLDAYKPQLSLKTGGDRFPVADLVQNFDIVSIKYSGQSTPSYVHGGVNDIFYTNTNKFQEMVRGVGILQRQNLVLQGAVPVTEGIDGAEAVFFPKGPDLPDAGLHVAIPERFVDVERAKILNFGAENYPDAYRVFLKNAGNDPVKALELMADRIVPLGHYAPTVARSLSPDNVSQVQETAVTELGHPQGIDPGNLEGVPITPAEAPNPSPTTVNIDQASEMARENVIPGEVGPIPITAEPVALSALNAAGNIVSLGSSYQGLQSSLKQGDTTGVVLNGGSLASGISTVAGSAFTAAGATALGGALVTAGTAGALIFGGAAYTIAGLQATKAYITDPTSSYYLQELENSGAQLAIPYLLTHNFTLPPTSSYLSANPASLFASNNLTASSLTTGNETTNGAATSNAPVGGNPSGSNLPMFQLRAVQNEYLPGASFGGSEEELIPIDGSGGPVNAALQIGGVNPGGVLIDQAAQLVGANVKDITGATFDPVSNQLVFLGNSAPATLHNVNLDLFTTAIQTVYGSAVPPYVTLDPSAKLVSQTFDIGSGNGVIPTGKSANVLINYTPYTPSEADDMTLSFNLNGTPVSVRLNGWVMNGQGGLTLSGGGRYGMGLTLANGTPNGSGQSTAPSGVSGVNVQMTSFGVDALKPQFSAGSINLTAGGSVNLGNVGGAGYTLVVNAQGQQSTWAFTINNSSGATETVTNIKLVPDLQERQFGGRVDNTKLGWIMEEADRVMKELAGGKDQLTNAIYDSHNSSLSPLGFRNTLERYVANNQSGNFSNRFWFTPNYETLKRYVDPVTGQATVVFDQSSVKLNTEALILGQPEDPTARGFADWFNANYEAVAQLSFPVHDPADPTGAHVIQEKIFQDLEDAMKAVALARFFHDNSIPLDTWWLSSYTPPAATVPATIPTLTNSLSNGSVTVNFYGGVSIKTPNSYLPDVVAQAVNNDVQSQRTPGTGDLATQSWSVSGTPVGNLNAVAASLDQQQQSGNITLAATDLSFDSLGGRQLNFERYYNSAYLGSGTLGLGWQPNCYQLQFQLPSYVDSYGLMRDSSGNALPVSGATADTLIRSGEIRFVDQSTGQLLNFFSSVSTSYALDGQGNPILSTSGLAAGDVPTFTAGQYQDGSTLAQDSATHNYSLTRPDGRKIVFDAQGNLLSTTDAMGHAITYGYSSGQLSQITDAAGQKLAITYGTNGLIQYVAGPDNSATPMRRIAYTYDTAGKLTEVDSQSLQSGNTYSTVRSTKYQYSANKQLSAVIGPDGLTTLAAALDLRGRSTQSQDVLGNMIDSAYMQNSATGLRTTQTTDMGTTAANDPTAQGIAALEYVAAGATSSTQFDGTARLTQSTDALQNTTQYGYTGNSLLPNTVTLPTPGRPAISIQRNSANLPTTITDPANTGGGPVQITYNSANLPTQVTDAMGVVTKYTYTAWNDVATVTVGFGTPLAATTTYNYNAQMLLASIVDPMGHTVASYTYDTMGRVLTATDGDNVTTSYVYDSLGRLSKVFDPRLTGATKFIQYTYNDNDQVTQESTPIGNITYQYDAVTHRLTSVMDLAGVTTQYAYDPANGQLTSVSQVHSGGNAVSQEYFDRLGRLTLTIAPNGTRTAFRYDSLGRPIDVITDDGAAPTATVGFQPGGGSTAPSLNVAASEPILVASVKYWQHGQSIATAQTQSVRLADQAAFALTLAGANPALEYDYQVTLTDRVGLSQSLLLVTNNSDSGSGSLRQAVLDAAGTPGVAHTIQFLLPSDQQTITLLSPLPAIADPLVALLDGTQNVTVASSSSNPWDSYAVVDKTGDGTLTLRETSSFGGNLEIESGLLRLNEPATPSYAAGAAVTIGGAATLELAGPVSALTRTVSIANNSTAAAGISVTGARQVAGNIDGLGATAVNSAADLIANHIIQGALLIGGTADIAATLTIAPSDALGNPLGESSATASVIADGSFAVNTLSTAALGETVADETSAGAAADTGGSRRLSAIASADLITAAAGWETPPEVGRAAVQVIPLTVRIERVIDDLVQAIADGRNLGINLTGNELSGSSQEVGEQPRPILGSQAVEIALVRKSSAFPSSIMPESGAHYLRPAARTAAVEDIVDEGPIGVLTDKLLESWV